MSVQGIILTGSLANNGCVRRINCADCEGYWVQIGGGHWTVEPRESLCFQQRLGLAVQRENEFYLGWKLGRCFSESDVTPQCALAQPHTVVIGTPIFRVSNTSGVWSS